MGTHNRLLRIDTPEFPRAYFEILAIDPHASPPARRRWFDLDDEALRAAVRDVPKLMHFVAAVEDISIATKTLAALGIDRGPAIDAQRETANGTLRWRISVRDDGQRLLSGALPTLIEWQGVHPVDAMPASGVTLGSLRVCHPRPQMLEQAYAAVGLTQVQVRAGPPNVLATLRTPKGEVTLESGGI